LFEATMVAGDLGSARTPVVFYDGYYLQVVWSEDRGPGPDLYIQGFDGGGNAVGHPRRITESHRARRPVVLQIDDAFVIAWSDRVQGMMEVMAAGLNPRGGELLAAVNVSNTNVNASHSPSLVELGGKPVIVYKERLMLASIHSLKAVELDLQGRPEGETLSFQEIVAVPYNPAAASNGRTIMIASNSFSSGKWSLAFTPLRSLKKQPEPVMPIETEANLWAPAIVGLGDGFLVAYRNNGDIVPGVEVAQVDTDGSLISTISAAIMLQDFDFEPAMISDGDQAMLVLREEFLGEILLNVERFDSGGNITGSKMLVKGVGLGDPASAVLMDGDICVAYESLAEGLGSVHLGCFEVPGGGS
jgi:hypothetical protein